MNETKVKRFVVKAAGDKRSMMEGIASELGYINRMFKSIVTDLYRPNPDTYRLNKSLGRDYNRIREAIRDLKQLGGIGFTNQAIPLLESALKAILTTMKVYHDDPETAANYLKQAIKLIDKVIQKL